jgi:radical SAM-linked protein
MREERLVYLTKLGAQSRRVAVAKPVAEPLPPGITPKKKKPPTIVQGEPRRYRFVYTKVGASAFLSHLDLIRALPRAFRRNELPLFYSSGFHPKPDMTFGPALSLGVPSLGEVVDVKLTAELSPADYLEALSASAPDGLDFTGAVRLGGDDAAVSRLIDTARYAVAFPRSVLAARGGEAWLRDRVLAILAATELPQVRRIEGIGKAIDVRAFLRHVEVGSPIASEAVRASGLLGDLVTMLVDVAVTGSGSVKISEVLEALGTKEEPLEHRAIRVMVGAFRSGTLHSTLELDAIRKEPERKSLGTPLAPTV